MGHEETGCGHSCNCESEGEAVSLLVTHTIFVEEMRKHLLPICEGIPLQFLAYFMAINNGIDVDRPRNLIKAVFRSKWEYEFLSSD